MVINKNELNDKLSYLTFPVSKGQQESLKRYLESMVFWNRTHNLTAITKPSEMIVKHLLDSLVIKPFLEGKSTKRGKAKALRVIDIGSGAGLPGIPLAIVLPQVCFTLLDSSQKRTFFLKQMALDLQLDNIEVVHQRVQDFSPADFLQNKEKESGYDVAISRAFASAHDFIVWSSHLVKKGGSLFAMKGQLDEDEWQAIESGWEKEVFALSVPFLDESRHLVELTRINS